MGYGGYNFESRTLRAASSGFQTKSAKQLFSEELHKEMDPKGVKLRECRDSADHPNAIDIQFYLDVTGSMGHIPLEMIQKGLPTLMSGLLQNGVQDPALMFAAIGDHECDRAPLQVAQFESSDEALDMWLQRTWLEGKGGGNAGESYLLAWYFAAFHTAKDRWDKRKQKGYIFTIGDEPTLTNLPLTAIKEIMGDTAAGQKDYTAAELLSLVMVKHHVYHISLEHGYRNTDQTWKQLLGDHLIVIDDHEKVATTISNLILENENKVIKQGNQTITNGTPPKEVVNVPTHNGNILL